ncbi:MAG: NUDIX hydrolase [Cytophagales bacterium]|nr:NUDIX hydrolase [Cytophaga sp.]
MDKQQIKVAVDAVVFGYSSREGLLVLLIKRGIVPYKNEWALPGGLVKNDESLDEAAERELMEETGIRLKYLEQLYTFGVQERDPRNRVVSVSYVGLVRPDVFSIKADTDASDVSWFNIKKLPQLAFDHKDIIKVALKRLQSKLSYEPIGFELLEPKFPFSELEKLYMTVLDKPIDRRNFKKKIMSYGFVEETSIVQKLEGAGRPGHLYKFNEKKYLQLKKDGIFFEL